MTAPRKDRKPWPMKWIVLSIVIFIPVYTYLTLHFRRKDPAFQPYQDMRDRADVIRLLKAGYQRVTVDASRPAESAAEAGDPTSRAPGGLPPDLKGTLIESPLLPLSIGSVSAATTAASAIDYQIGLTYTLADNKRQLSGAHLYERESDIVIVADFEMLGGGLLARTREGTALITVPPGCIRPGKYRVTLVGERESRAWSLLVR
ncbi:MAG TPA: hypothetical protein VN877_08525 [Opitutaceae bacterium]|nr:hypothetical protein [Opitutaceae bacterium]